jgi:hypothetical protein
MSTTVEGSAAATTSSRAHSRQRIATVALGVVVALVGWLVARLVAGPLSADMGSSVIEVTLLGAGVASAVVGFLGWGVLTMLERTRRPRSTWIVLASVVLLLSFGGPLSAVGTGAVVALLCLHVAVGAVLIVGLARTVKH